VKVCNSNIMKGGNSKCT